MPAVAGYVAPTSDGRDAFALTGCKLHLKVLTFGYLDTLPLPNSISHLKETWLDRYCHVELVY